jgi:enolase 1/2/3
MEKVRILSIRGYRILNSHTQWTNEFVVHLEDGRWGRGSSPRGETTSVYEDQPVSIKPEEIIHCISADAFYQIPYTQREFDRYLAGHVARFGRNNCFALSVAFSDANSFGSGVENAGDIGNKAAVFPAICLNILNGGRYAYTNPVRSDFSEFLLVPRHNDLHRTLKEHEHIQQRIKAGLIQGKRTTVNGNLVHDIGGNRGCIEFMLAVLDDLKLRDHYGLMIDASAGDLKVDGGYRLEVTGEGFFEVMKFVGMWKSYIREYGVAFLEDPFAEDDFESWKSLTADRGGCHVIGDNLYASDAERIMRGARDGWTTGVVIKPDQSGSVTAAREAISACETGQQLMISSHRSISTESMIVVTLTARHQIGYIKVGPLMTDYSAVMRINEFIREMEGIGCQ